ncbi:MAG: hypothetical protein ACI9LE_001366 [Paraglaciecola sp.]|jgi:hypothetical protein
MVAARIPTANNNHATFSQLAASMKLGLRANQTKLIKEIGPSHNSLGAIVSHSIIAIPTEAEISRTPNRIFSKFLDFFAIA